MQQTEDADDARISVMEQAASLTPEKTEPDNDASLADIRDSLAVMIEMMNAMLIVLRQIASQEQPQQVLSDQ